MLTDQLSEAMRDTLAFVLPTRAGSIHDYEREAERWVRMAPKVTLEALERRGLAEKASVDYPCGGYRARLTDAGAATRRELLG